MKYRYAVLGAGRQGTAAAYDFARNGNAEKVVITDIHGEVASTAARRINDLLKGSSAPQIEARQLDVKNRDAFLSFLKGFHVFLSAVPFYHNLEIAKCALEAGVSMTDLGGNTDIVFQELDLDQPARQKRITIVPDCGMVPGLGTSVCMYAMSFVEEPEEIYLWDGGLPQEPREPWKYILTFHFEGLINEFWGTTEFLRDGKIVKVPCFEEPEVLEFPQPIGRLEAVTSAGGTSSAPRTFLGKLRTYENKTLRYPGHYAHFKALWDAGLFSPDPVDVKGVHVRPRDVLAAVLDPQIRAKEGEKDVCIIRGKCVGRSKGKKVESVVDLFDYYDESTGFTSMERTTGWHATIIAIMIAHGEIPAGAIPVELAVSGERMMNECRKRGMKIHHAETEL